MEQEMKPYQGRYDEALAKAVDVLAMCEAMPPKPQAEVLLLFLIEFSQAWYKAKCAALEYAVEQYAATANGYAAGIALIRKKIVALVEKKESPLEGKYKK